MADANTHILSTTATNPDDQLRITKADGPARPVGVGVEGELSTANVSLGERITSWVVRFVLLMATWLVLSGMFDPFHIGLGVIASLFVTWLSEGIFPPEVVQLGRTGGYFRLAAYLPWLVWEIVKANVWVLRLAFTPNVESKIRPQLVTFKTRLTSPMALTVLANSITLTPGTITASIDTRGYVTVHAIDTRTAEAVPGDMEQKILEIFEPDNPLREAK